MWAAHAKEIEMENKRAHISMDWTSQNKFWQVEICGKIFFYFLYL